jgi:hypothetical protein
VHRRRLLLQCRKIAWPQARAQSRQLLAAAAAFEQRAFGGVVRVAEFDAQQETIQLRFGQGEGADLVRWILRGNDEKRLRQGPRLALGGHLSLFHGFEQRALRLWRRAVDLVGEQHLREHRSGQKAEITAIAVENRNAKNVRGQHVAGELDAGELETEQAQARVCASVVLPTPGRSSISR